MALVMVVGEAGAESEAVDDEEEEEEDGGQEADKGEPALSGEPRGGGGASICSFVCFRLGLPSAQPSNAEPNAKPQCHSLPLAEIRSSTAAHQPAFGQRSGSIGARSQPTGSRRWNAVCFGLTLLGLMPGFGCCTPRKQAGCQYRQGRD